MIVLVLVVIASAHLIIQSRMEARRVAEREAVAAVERERVAAIERAEEERRKAAELSARADAMLLEARERLAAEQAAEAERLRLETEAAEAAANVPGTIEGEAWLATTDGGTRSVAGSGVLLLPPELSTSDPRLQELKSTLREDTISAQQTLKNSPNNPYFEARALACETLNDFGSPVLSSRSCTISQLTELNALMAGKMVVEASLTKSVADIYRKRFFAAATASDINTILTENAISLTRTSRDGKFKFEGVKPGNYVLVCIVAYSEINEVVQWAKPVKIEPGKMVEVELSNPDANIMHFRP